jgi:Holliday junction DNA helicase RuvB
MSKILTCIADAGDSNSPLVEKEFDKVLRPLVFDDFAGQRKVVDNLLVFVKAAQQRKESLGPCTSARSLRD